MIKEESKVMKIVPKKVMVEESKVISRVIPKKTQIDLPKIYLNGPLKDDSTYKQLE